ncbi:MAG: hypothetical protein ACTSQI_19700 [Candidatus Helarchaeota archaeon]
MDEKENRYGNRDYKKILFWVGIATGLGLIFIQSLGCIYGFLYYGFLICITIFVSIIGYVGGLWLWEYLTTSKLLKDDYKKLIKRGGIFALLGFIFLIIMSGYIAFMAEIELLHSIINFINWVLLFMCAYNTGYLLSIWRDGGVAGASERADLEQKGKVDWEIIRAVVKLAAPSLLVIMSSTLMIGIIQEWFDFVLVAFGFQLLLFGGFCLGYIIWEHLKKTNLIIGDFRKQLRWISLIFMIILGGLTIYGFIVSFDLIIAELLRHLMLYYTIFLICMFFYFLGLYVSLIKSE